MLCLTSALFLTLTSTCWCDHLDPARDLAGQPVDLVGVLALGELPVEERNIVVRLVLEDLHSLPATGLVLTRLGHCVQLGHCIEPLE